MECCGLMDVDVVAVADDRKSDAEEEVEEDAAAAAARGAAATAGGCSSGEEEEEWSIFVVVNNDKELGQLSSQDLVKCRRFSHDLSLAMKEEVKGSSRHFARKQLLFSSSLLAVWESLITSKHFCIEMMATYIP